jgi:ferritin-like metal-binding protein YciE
MPDRGLRDLYIDELKDLYSAEKQLTKALPKFAKAASSTELRGGFEEHLAQTEEQIRRLEQIFEMLEEKPTGKKCKGMEGLVAEGAEIMQEDYEGALMDAALIGAAQRVEHYEIAAYGTAIAFAAVLEETDQVALLNETLEEERETDEKLSEIAEQINADANSPGDEGDAPQSGEGREPARKKRGGRAA